LSGGDDFLGLCTWCVGLGVAGEGEERGGRQPSTNVVLSLAIPTRDAANVAYGSVFGRPRTVIVVVMGNADLLGAGTEVGKSNGIIDDKP
jgi:hypothetical protein